MPISRDKLKRRAELASHRPKFRRPESWRYKRLDTTWRRPKGVDNHIRKQLSRGRPGLVKIGYGGPRDTRGIHPSGYTDNLVFNVGDLGSLDHKTDGVRIGHSVGSRKRKEIVQAALERKLKVFNARVERVGSKS
jgi:large subunit ribosomal protein L32e